MKPLIIVDNAALPPAKQSTITLRYALGFGAACELADEWAALRRELGGEPSDMHAAYLLLSHYIIDWHGPAFAAVGPYSLHALSQVNPYLPIMATACTAVLAHHTRATKPIVQPTAPPIDDPEYEAMVDRWRQKLRADDGRTTVAGHHDAMVSLIAYGKWTQRQIEEEFEPDVLQELLARLDAEARNHEDQAKGKKPKGPRPAKPRSRAELIQEMSLWGRQPPAPEVA